MDFSKKIVKIRKDNNLTQEELAEKLNVSRQAVSNWENNRNLPDIEMLIIISKRFSISLDDLILGDKNMNDIEKKIINDGSENKRAKMTLISTIIGAFLMIMGLLLFFVKSQAIEYIDEFGILHENFFLIPMGYLFLLTGLIVIIFNMMKNRKLKYLK